MKLGLSLKWLESHPDRISNKCLATRVSICIHQVNSEVEDLVRERPLYPT